MVTLRRYKQGDAKQLAELIGNPKVLINLSDGLREPYTINDADNFIENALGKNQFRFAIEYNGVYCGGIGLDDISGHCGHDRAKEIGYWLGEEFWNKGIITEAIKQICKKGFEELNLVRIEANVFVYNTFSMHVLIKCGFVEEGVQRKGAIKDEKIVDSHRFALVK